MDSELTEDAEGRKALADRLNAVIKAANEALEAIQDSCGHDWVDKEHARGHDGYGPTNHWTVWSECRVCGRGEYRDESL